MSLLRHVPEAVVPALGRQLVVVDLFSGTGSSTIAFAERGHRVLRVEKDRQHAAEWHADVTRVTAEEVRSRLNGLPVDFVWLSPPCTAFSVASIGRHWARGGNDPQPKSVHAVEGLRVVRLALDLVEALQPRWWLLENPRGMLRKVRMMQSLRRWTVTYCQYGDTRMKPTDLWGVMPDRWRPRAACKNGDTCHVSAPAGSSTGTQGLKSVVDRARVPRALSDEVCAAIEGAAA